MAQEFHPGQTVPESGVYRVSHDPVHPDMPHEVTVIKGRRFPTCRGCKGISFALVHAAGNEFHAVTQRSESDMPNDDEVPARRQTIEAELTEVVCGYSAPETW